MNRPNYLEQIRGRIDAAEPGAVFIPSDFFDIASAVKVNMCLNRLKESGYLHIVIRGVFSKPRYSVLLNEYISPRSDDIANAIARNYGWTIVPYGDTALNMLGLSTQIPAVWQYISDGPYKTYDTGGVKLKFNHTDKRNEIIEVSYRTALIIQALKALGKNNITDMEILKLSTAFTCDEKEKMLFEGKRITAWVYEYIKQICVRDSHE